MPISEIAKATVEMTASAIENKPGKFEVPEIQDATEKTAARPEPFDAREIRDEVGDVSNIDGKPDRFEVPETQDMAEKSATGPEKFEAQEIGNKLGDVVKSKADIGKGAPVEGNGGRWTGERGNSDWIPSGDVIPEKYKSNNSTWNEICDKYGIEKVSFKEGNLDLSEISKGNVEIDNFSESRRKNFVQADEKLAESRNCTPGEVAQWRTENGYTWHEWADCTTMQKVPSEVHNNIPHYGGIAVTKD